MEGDASRNHSSKAVPLHIDPLIEQAVVNAVKDIDGIELVLPLKHPGCFPDEGFMTAPYNLDPIVVTVRHYDETLHVAYDTVPIPTIRKCKATDDSIVHTTSTNAYHRIPVEEIVQAIPDLISEAFSSRTIPAQIARRHGIDAPIPVPADHERITLRDYGHMLISRAVADHIVSTYGLPHLIDMVDGILRAYWDNEWDVDHPDIWEALIYICLPDHEDECIIDLTIKVGSLPSLLDGKGLYVPDDIPETIASQVKGETFSRIIDAPGASIPNLRIKSIQLDQPRTLPWMPENEMERSTIIHHDSQWVTLREFCERHAS